MEMQSVLICVHGYTREPKPMHRTWESVVEDRLRTAIKLARFFKSTKVISYLILSGGVVTNGVVEADRIYELARKKFPALFDMVTDVILERESKNTQENVDEIMKWAKKKNAAIIAVSSKDHISRIAKDWAYDKNVSEHLVMVAPSEESYSESGDKNAPIVIEPPFWAYDSLKDILYVHDDKKEDVKKKIRDAVRSGLE